MSREAVELRILQEKAHLGKLTMETFIAAQDFSLAGLEYEDNNESHNTGVAFDASWRVTVINHAVMGHAAYITQLADGIERTYAVPPVHKHLDHMRDAELFPRRFPDVTQSAGKELGFVESLQTPTAVELFTLSAVMKYLAVNAAVPKTN